MEVSKLLELPTPDVLNKIYHELGISEDGIKSDVKTIAEWMRKQPHLHNVEVDEQRIRMYLILRKNSLEKTKEIMEQYYTIKPMLPEYLGGWDPTLPALQQSMDLVLFIPLAKLTEEGHRVSISRMRKPNVDKYVYADYVKVCFMSIDIRMSKLDVFKTDIFIFDLSKYTMSHLPLVVPELKKSMYCMTAAYALRIHQMHIINMPSFVQSAFNMVLGMLSKKIAGKIIIHENVEGLKKYINPDILPLDYGGTYPKTSEEISEEWKEELVKHRDWFLSQNSQVSDESRRIKKHNVNMDMLTGVEGSFRKLEVD